MLSTCSPTVKLQGKPKPNQKPFIDFSGKSIAKQDKNTHNYMISAFSMLVKMYGD